MQSIPIIESFMSNYVIVPLSAYLCKPGNTKQKQSLADKVGKILLGRGVDDP